MKYVVKQLIVKEIGKELFVKDKTILIRIWSQKVRFCTIVHIIQIHFVFLYHIICNLQFFRYDCVGTQKLANDYRPSSHALDPNNPHLATFFILYWYVSYNYFCC